MSEGLKLNIGSGFRRIDGFLNIDDDKNVEPDYLLNLETDKLPFEDNSVIEIRLHQILEHIGAGFFHLMKEMYRVCKHGAILDIESPHHFYDGFFIDPSHCRFITVEGMRLFSKKFNRECIAKYGSSSGMGIRHNVDFEIVHYDFRYDSFYHGMIENYNKRKEQGQTTPEEDFMYVRLFREANNVATDVLIKMVAIKE